eukprot:TRINITY_DN66469_c9_g10_i1.p1 TRINITY_DN66469_c9_g10~~TRINITY_DN66469_c9_g10_i1.p1  ORF type:complete len:835 (+),score=497.13 TRINITY_DN66469_c9_g10_i1:60-2564(+)
MFMHALIAMATATHGGIEGGLGTNVMFGFIGGGVALAVAIFYAWKVSQITLDKEKFPEAVKISELIAEGADAFLRSEYKVLAIFVFLVGILLLALIAWQTAINFWFGAILSALSGYIGMKIATMANIRTTLACQGPTGLNDGLQVAFRSGAVMALSVVSSGLLGLSLMYIIFREEDSAKVWEHLSGFAFGGSSIALFARVGGGIYTKAADVGADLVGKVENDLAEDSPDNPATIADNVGDNVGDVAGMGADLFESFVGSIIATATIGFDEFGPAGEGAVMLPFAIAGLGALCSIAGTMMVRIDPSKDATKGADQEMQNVNTGNGDAGHDDSESILEELLISIRNGIWGASALVLVASIFAVWMSFGLDTKKDGEFAWQLLACVAAGLVCGNAIGYFTEYATSYTYWPTQSIARKSDTGPATVMIQGLGVGMLSTVPPVIFIVATILGTYYISAPHGVYGVAVSAVGMLSTLGVTLATDAFGPVADNAGGIAEMSQDPDMSDATRETTDALDALGNTTAATGKGFAIGSAVLTALALMNAFAESAGLYVDSSSPLGAPIVSLLDPVVLPGVLLGALLPFVFAAQTMLSVGRSAESIMWEVRLQMNDKALRNKPLDSQRCVAICTQASLREMVMPGTLAVFAPILVGTAMGAIGLMGMLTGAISSGFLLAVMMSNAGGAWDNAKKWVEKDNLGPGRGKRSENHKAVVVGDTVGDPFKDTSGPSLNILIKLMSIVSLVIGPSLEKHPWQNEVAGWPAALVVLVVLIVGLWAYDRFAGKAKLHDEETIIAESQKRRAMEKDVEAGDVVAPTMEDEKKDDEEVVDEPAAEQEEAAEKEA